jgi:hypothetical protein
VTIETDATQNQESGGSAAEFRYGVVFVLMLALVVFVISAPSANWSRAVALAMEGAALVVAIATAREPDEARYRKALVVGMVLIGLTIIVAAGTASLTFTTVVAALLAAMTAGPFITLDARSRGATDDNVRRAIAVFPGMLQRIDGWIEEGTLGGEPPNAADLQIAPSLRLAMSLDDLRPAIEGRPAGRLATQIVKHFPGRTPAVLPPEWLEPLTAPEGLSDQILVCCTWHLAGDSASLVRWTISVSVPDCLADPPARSRRARRPAIYPADTQAGLGQGQHGSSEFRQFRNPKRRVPTSPIRSRALSRLDRRKRSWTTRSLFRALGGASCDG